MFLRDKRLSVTVSVSSMALLAAALLYSLPAAAETPTVTSLSAETMLANIATQIPQLMRLATAIGYVLGMLFIVIGIMKLKQYGESRTMMSQGHSLLGPIMYLVSGTLLMYLPTSVEIGMSTFWSTPNPYGYIEQTDQWSTFLNDCLLIIQLIGTIAFIRGLTMLSHVGQQGQPGQTNKAITFIISGILCINMYQFLQIIFATLGIQT